MCQSTVHNATQATYISTYIAIPTLLAPWVCYRQYTVYSVKYI